MIELRNVSHTYVTERSGRSTTTEAVAGVSLTIPTLQFRGVIGTSGSGKTTLLRLIAWRVTRPLGQRPGTR